MNIVFLKKHDVYHIIENIHLISNGFFRDVEGKKSVNFYRTVYLMLVMKDKVYVKTMNNNNFMYFYLERTYTFSITEKQNITQNLLGKVDKMSHF
jgi:hypothetical protein